MNRFLRELKAAKRGEQALLRGLTRSESRKIQPDELNRVASLWGAATQVLHAYLVAEGAKDWLFDEDLDRLARTDRSMQPSGELTVHHIFPRKVLAAVLDEPLDANRLANFALISRSSNSQLGDRLPDEVLATMDADQRRRAEVQFFGAVAGDKLNEGRFAEFCEWRSARLADALNQFLAA
jgi:hypothetical protein